MAAANKTEAATVVLAELHADMPWPAPAIWEILSDFAHPQRLAATIDSADLVGTGIGAVRTVRSSRGLVIKEQLLESDGCEYRFRYAILLSGDMPFAHVTSYHCTVRLYPQSLTSCQIHWLSEGRIDGPIGPIRNFLTVLYSNANRQISEQIGANMSAIATTHTAQRIDQILSSAVDSGVAAGFVGIVANCEGTISSTTSGVKTVGSSVAMTCDTLFWLASMTKLVTTIAAMQLVETDRLSLDSPVTGLLPELADMQVLEGFDASGRPELRPAESIITLRQLLTHRSGLGYDLMNPKLMRARGANGPPPATTLASLHRPLLFDPGEGWVYGVGIDWAGLAIERCTETKLDQLFAEKIFIPLAMNDTGFDNHTSNPERCSATHMRLHDGRLGTFPSPMGHPEDWEFHSGGGGLTGTATDYIRLLRMLLGGGELDGHRVLSSATVESMWDNQVGKMAAGCIDTAMPALCLPYDPIPGQKGEWSLLGVRNAFDIPQRRRAGSASWVGAGGTFFWLDRESDLCGVLLAQLLPFADPELLGVQRDFEAAAYA